MPQNGCRVIRAATLPLDRAPLPAAQVVQGAPLVGAAVIDVPLVDVEVGVWEHTAGTSRDVEVDEVFVVLGGAATVEVEGEGVLEMGPGDVGVLRAGARTTWHVTSALRKVYLTRS